jgi:iron complex transport system ATP-binding protein
MNEKDVSGPAGWHLECARLTVERDGRPVLWDVSLGLRGDECVSLVGPNGSGKTTLMLALLGLLPPARGTIRLNGQDLARYSARQRGRFAAYVPQIVESAPALRVYDVIAGGRFPHRGPLGRLSNADHAVIRSALDRCGLSGLADRPFNAISGGERQKALLAAAIAQGPQVLFLDEPSTALDPAYQVELVHILRDWHRAGRGLVVISHDLQLPAALDGRVIALRAGRLAADGPAGEVLTPVRLSEIYGARLATATTPGGLPVVLPEWW